MKNSTLLIMLFGAVGAAVYFVGKQGQKIRLWTLPRAGLKYKKQFDYTTLVYQLPKNILARMAQQESSYRPNVVSSAGAVGLMQIVPRFHPRVDPTKPMESIYYAGEYMRILYNRFGDWRLALAAYNWGPTNLAKKGFKNAPAKS